jgi:hypothetical protein
MGRDIIKKYRINSYLCTPLKNRIYYMSFNINKQLNAEDQESLAAGNAPKILRQQMILLKQFQNLYKKQHHVLKQHMMILTGAGTNVM